MLTDPALTLAMPFGLSLPTLLGVGGFLLYAGADIALCLRRLSSEGIAFYLLNIAAATLIGVSLLYSFNLGAFLTEAFCLGTSILAVVLRVRDRRTAPAQHAVRPTRTRALPQVMQGARPMPSPVNGPLTGALTGSATGKPGRGLCPDRMA